MNTAEAKATERLNCAQSIVASIHQLVKDCYEAHDFEPFNILCKEFGDETVFGVVLSTAMLEGEEAALEELAGYYNL